MSRPHAQIDLRRMYRSGTGTHSHDDEVDNDDELDGNDARDFEHEFELDRRDGRSDPSASRRFDNDTDVGGYGEDEEVQWMCCFETGHSGWTTYSLALIRVCVRSTSKATKSTSLSSKGALL